MMVSLSAQYRRPSMTSAPSLPAPIPTLTARPVDEGERRTFIAGNMYLDVVRKEAISLALKEDDFETAMRFAREGMDLAEREKHAGTADEYADLLVEALEARGDASAALTFIEARIIEQQSMDWLGKLKARMPDKKKWELFRERILGSLPSDTRDFMGEILASESSVAMLASPR